MKTIKEQQTEYVLAHTELVESYEAYAEKEEIAAAYEAGANYVRDVIIHVLSLPIEDTLLVRELWYTIKQLKE